MCNQFEYHGSQTQRQLKETLYDTIIDYFDKGKVSIVLDYIMLLFLSEIWSFDYFHFEEFMTFLNIVFGSRAKFYYWLKFNEITEIFFTLE